MLKTENEKRKPIFFLLILSAAAVSAIYLFFFFNAQPEQKAQERKELLPPSFINATDGKSTTSVTVNWEATGESDIYALFRSDGGEFVSINDTLKKTQYDDFNITQGVVYYYKVRSGNVSDWSDFSPVESGYAFLSAPKIEEVSRGKYPDRIAIRWKGIKDAKKYALFRSLSSQGEYRMLSEELIKGRYVDRDIEPGVEYYYKLKIKVGDLWSDFTPAKSGYAYVKAARVAASNGSVKSAIKISWKKVEGAHRYALYRSKGADEEYSLIDDSITGDVYIDTDIERGKGYYYKLKTYQNGKWSGFGKADRGFAALSAPPGVIASDGDESSQIKVSWEEVKDAKRYALYRSTKSDKDFVLIKKGIEKNIYFDKEVIRGTRYYYRLKAINELESGYSKTDTGHAALLPPLRVLATDGSREKIIVSWEKSSGAKYYELYRSTEKEKGYELINKKIESDYYEDRNIDGGKSYYYKLKAANGIFKSVYSNIESGYTGINTPSGLKASDGLNPYQIDISWNKADVQSYRVYRAEKSTGSYAPVSALVTETKFQDKNISYCTTYYYRIKGFKNDRWSDFSTIESGYGKCGAFVATYAGSGKMGNRDNDDFNRPVGVAAAGKRVYVADTFNHQIRAIDTEGMVTLLAGSGEAGSEDGTGRGASFYMPTGITVGPSGNIYVAEVDNHLIRKITPKGEVTKFAGSGLKGDRDGHGTNARFNHPYMIVSDKDETLYVTEFGNSKIRKITKKGDVTTFAGTGEKGARDGSVSYAQFDNPAGIVVDRDGNIYVSDSNNNNIRKITRQGDVISLAGSKKRGDNDGKGPAASFNNPRGLAIDHKGNIFVADSGNHMIRMVTPDGNVKTIAGSTNSGRDDGYGADASFFSPMDVSVDGKGNIYVAGYHNHKIRKITIYSSVKNLADAD